MGPEKKSIEQEISDEVVALLYERFERIRDRAFAPLRVLRYRIILKKIRIAIGKE